MKVPFIFITLCVVRASMCVSVCVRTMPLLPSKYVFLCLSAIDYENFYLCMCV